MDDRRLASLVDILIVSRVEKTFQALADPTRRAMLDRLAGGERRVGELTAGFAISATAAAKHLAMLEAAGLVACRREGRYRRCALDADPLVEAGLWLRRWDCFGSPMVARKAALVARAEAIG
nr:Helix-turn-helix domain [uncultured organism]